MEIIKAGGTKQIENFAVTINHCYDTSMSVDVRAGKCRSKKTGIFINGEDMCAASGWLSHEAAFQIARVCMKGTKWAF